MEKLYQFCKSVYFYPLTLAAGIIVLDQLTKQLILAFIESLPQAVIPGFFALTFAWNRGVSFSMFADADTPLNLFGIHLPADAYLPAFLRWLPREETTLRRLGIGLIIGGALGNMLDRLQHGAVVDFLLFYHHPYYFPAFNVADSAITIGVILLIATHFWHTSKIKKEKNPTETLQA